MIRHPPINDLALAAAVSKPTRSVAPRSSTAAPIDSRAPLHRAMADTGYIRNPIEAKRRSANAGPAHLVINELRKPFFTGCAKSKQMTLPTRGRATVIANTNEAPVLADQVAADHGVSAPALSPAHRTNEGNFGAAPGAGVRAIQVLWQVDTRTSLFPCAAPGYPDDSRLVTGPLLAMGVSRIAFVGGVEGSAKVAERLSGVLAPSVKTGLPQTILPSRPVGRKVATLLTGPAFDPALYINAAPQVNDLVGLRVLNEFAEFCRPVRRDVSLVSFDTIEDSGQFSSIFIAVHCNIAASGSHNTATTLAQPKSDRRPDPVTRTRVDRMIHAFCARA